MSLLSLKKIIRLLLCFIFINITTSHSQNLDLLSKKCPSNWAFFIGEAHHIKEIRNHLYKLIVENNNAKKNTVLFIEYPKSYNYRLQTYFKSGKEDDLHKIGQISMFGKGTDSIKLDFENLLRNIYKLNKQSKNIKISVEAIDKEIHDSITLTLLDEQFKIREKNTNPKTIFDSVFYYYKTSFGKKYFIYRLIDFCKVNEIKLISKYGQEAFNQMMYSFKGLSIPYQAGAFFAKKSLRDSLMCANFLEVLKKYENCNYFVQFGARHIYDGIIHIEGTKHKPNLYQYVKGSMYINNLCLTNAVYFSKKNMQEMGLISPQEATFLKQFEAGKMIENIDYPELKTLSTHFDYTIILEEATLMMPNGSKK
jgi:hypothetical protein